MRYGNSVRNVPWSPYDLKINKIYEAYHVYKANDSKYKENIADVLNNAINIINNTPWYLKKLYIKSNIKYAKIIRSGEDFGLDTEKIVFYIGINPQFNFNDPDDISISIPIDEKDFVQSEKHIFIKTSTEIKQVGIIITGSKNISTTDSINPYIRDISHELIHVFHGIKESELAAKAGDAYYYANEILKLNNCEFPTAIYF